VLGQRALAPLCGLVLFGLSLVGFAQAVAAVTLSFTGVVRHLEYERWLPDLSRRLVRSWLGIEVARPYRPKPVLSAPEPDGLYRHGNKLYKRAWLLRYRMLYGWLQHDPATHRDHVWELLTPITGGLAAGLPALLVVGGFLLPFWATIPLVGAGFVIGPAALRAYGVWSAALLGPVRLRLWDWVWQQATGCVLLARTFVMSLISFPYTLLTTVSVDPTVLRTWPQFTEEFRRLVNLRRRQISEWSGTRIDVPYLPPPPPPVPGPDGKYRSGKRLYDEPGPLIRAQLMRATYKDKAVGAAT
jgi:hypothetical protein